jgi:hypothetical protein
MKRMGETAGLVVPLQHQHPFPAVQRQTAAVSPPMPEPMTIASPLLRELCLFVGSTGGHCGPDFEFAGFSFEGDGTLWRFLPEYRRACRCVCPKT